MYTRFPEWIIHTSPELAEHALDLVAVLRWARRYAQAQPNKVLARINKLYPILGDSQPQLLPTFLEEVARIFAHEGRIDDAQELFAKARKAERVYALSIAPARHAAVFAEFAASGLISATTFTQEARDVATRLSPQNAYTYFLHLLLTQARAGVELYPNALRDLLMLGGKAGCTAEAVKQDFVAAYLPTRGFKHSSAELLDTIVATLSTLLDTHPELGRTLVTTIPHRWGISCYIHTLDTLGLWWALSTDADAFTAWLNNALGHAKAFASFFHDTNEEVLEAINRNARALAGWRLSLQPSRFHMDYLDAFAAAGMTITLTPSKSVGHNYFHIESWLDTHHRDLAHLLNIPGAREGVVCSLSPRVIADNVEVLLGCATMRLVLRLKLEAIRDEHVRALGSQEKCRQVAWQREHVTDIGLREVAPDVYDEIVAVDPVAVLAERIRRGTVVEYAWPLYERTVAATSGAVVSATFPWVCVIKGTQLWVLGGAVVREYQLPPQRVRKVIPTDDDVCVVSTDDVTGQDVWMWLSQRHIHPIEDYCFHNGTEQYVSVLEGMLFIGDCAMANAPLRIEPAGWQLGFGPVYATTDTDSTDAISDSLTVLPQGAKILWAQFAEQFAAGTLPGLELDDAAAVARKIGGSISFACSFTAYATEATRHSPLGVSAQSRHYGVTVRGDGGDFHHVSPLGVFTSTFLPFTTLLRPGGHVWYVRESGAAGIGHELYDAATDTPISPALTGAGEVHPLSFLPPAGLHHLFVRNEKASAAMRQCTYEQAKELVAHPERMCEFTCGDETLAAAIAGMLAEISTLKGVDVTLPVLTTVPEFLSHLYRTVSPPSQPSIPEPPEVVGDCYPELIQAFYGLAKELADPKDRGRANLEWSYSTLKNTIGREKLWLVWLAHIHRPIEDIRIHHKILRWSAQAGVFGTWRRITLPAVEVPFYEGAVWQEKTLIIHEFGCHARLWNEAITSRPEEAPNPQAFDDELFMPHDEFIAAVDQILLWHEHRHAAGNFDLPAWDAATIAEKSHEAARSTTLPPQVWACLFAGVHPDPYLNTGDISTEDAAGLLGLDRHTVADFSRVFQKASYALLDSIIAFSWHDDFLRTGPDCTKLATAWQRLWGPAWIQLTDKLWDQIPIVLRKSIRDDFHCNFSTIAFDVGKKRDPGLDQLLAVLVHLAHNVAPSGESARAIAAHIRQIGAFSSTEHLASTDHRSACLVAQGRLDDLIHHLESSTRIPGVQEDPLSSAPAVVADVTNTLGISNDAARYFLQILALAKPTDTHIRRWNRWTKKQLDCARNQLLARRLVISAQRHGSGRSVFVPGGWVSPRGGTHSHMEVWKAPFYLVKESNDYWPLLPTCPPLIPYPQLFTEAWQRYATDNTAHTNITNS